MAKLAFLFPGQGSQAVGMGKDLYDRFASARDMLDRAERAMETPLRELCFEGPEEGLRATEVAQVAILTVSAVCAKLLRKHGIEPQIVAGHSLGEYSALYSAGVLAFQDAVRLVRARGLAMAHAGQVQRGAMAAVIGLDAARLEALCREVMAETGQTVVLANINAPDQLIISGTPEGVAAASERARAAGAKRALPLPVSGAFHSQLMGPAQERLQEALAGVNFHWARVPVVTNVDASPTTDGADFAGKLTGQLLAPVRWTETMQVLLAQGADTFIEVGPGKVLANLAKRQAPGATILNVGDVASLEATIAALGQAAAETTG